MHEESCTVNTIIGQLGGKSMARLCCVLILTFTAYYLGWLLISAKEWK